jgi:heme O synthase-like polyprenyltransferase
MQLWHYYGDTVRRLFLMGGVLMILTLPLFTQLIPVGSTVAVLVIIVLRFLSGFVSPLHQVVAMINAAIAAAAVFFFEYYAVTGYLLPDATEHKQIFFYTNQILAIIFFFALYYSAKTIRGMRSN